MLPTRPDLHSYLANLVDCVTDIKCKVPKAIKRFVCLSSVSPASRSPSEFPREPTAIIMYHERSIDELWYIELKENMVHLFLYPSPAFSASLDWMHGLSQIRITDFVTPGHRLPDLAKWRQRSHIPQPSTCEPRDSSIGTQFQEIGGL